ncbi:hypothetical protein [Microbacterium sp.]|uniref:hypothetical protein n=1 Tax=Microbacterium sp. TaxID=51671 RepID=UPI0025F816D8|nr:hypothetical protein [Microbacterium sp.]
MTRFLVSAVAPNGSSIDRQQVEAASETQAAEQFLANHTWEPPLQVTSISRMPSDGGAFPDSVTIRRAGVFGIDSDGSERDFIEVSDWSHPVQYFVGRNGSGKSKAARAIALATGERLLTTDRLGRVD